MATLADFKSELATSLQNLVRVDVLTVVTSSQSPDPAKAASGPYLLTVVDLLNGDIRAEVNETLLDDKYAAIRAAHADREKQSLAMVQAHVELIGKVIQKIAELVQ